MMYGISGNTLPPALPYANPINQACIGYDFWPCVAGGVAFRETILGQLEGQWDAATVVSKDGGHGLFQLTSSWPKDWQDPYTNAVYAVKYYLIPACDFWAETQDETGWALVKCLAAEFNCGRSGALAGHRQGNVDLYTTNQNYGAAVVGYAQTLLTGKVPVVD
jgi:hypothetical protein